MPGPIPPDSRHTGHRRRVRLTHPAWPVRAAHAAPRHRRARLSRRPRVLRTVVALALVGGAVYGATVLAGSASGPHPPDRAATGVTHQPGTAARGSARGGVASTTTSTPSTTAPTTALTTSAPPTTDAGSLPQTDQFPTTTDPQFETDMDALWQGIVSDSLPTALPAFFPEAAYVQLKAIGDPAGDWQDRLVGQFGLDVGAAHAQLGPDPAAATLVAVNVPSQYGHWVPPGTCENSIGYFEVPNTRIVFQVDGQQSSFGIASMISWRGVWYVVHLGAVVPSGPGGQVDDPESGPGVSQASSTC